MVVLLLMVSWVLVSGAEGNERVIERLTFGLSHHAGAGDWGGAEAWAALADD